MGRQEALATEGGRVTISLAEYREYQELLGERDRSLQSLQSLRAQMRIQNEQALRLARAVNSGLIGDTPLGVAIVNNPAAAKAVELACDILATE